MNMILTICFIVMVLWFFIVSKLIMGAKKEQDARNKKRQATRLKNYRIAKDKIVTLLANNKKYSVSDINALIKHKDYEETKKMCEELYYDNQISFAGNGRYFISSQENVDKKITSDSTEESIVKNTKAKPKKNDIKSELKKYKEMLDEGLITQEQYDAKSNKLLGL